VPKSFLIYEPKELYRLSIFNYLFLMQKLQSTSF
jgi:hypothetical protein